MEKNARCEHCDWAESASGLAIEKLEKDWARHPVLHFSLSRCKSQPLQGMIDEISLQLSVYEKLYGKNPEETSIGKRLSGLVRRACEQTGQKTMLCRTRPMAGK
jgi:hypothetical protein